MVVDVTCWRNSYHPKIGQKCTHRSAGLADEDPVQDCSIWPLSLLKMLVVRDTECERIVPPVELQL